MQQALDTLAGEPIEIFVVWLPAIPSDRYEATEYATKIIHDERARHYWDGSQALGEALAPAMGMNAKLAWDVYVVFGKDAKWNDTPPVPASWLHQKFGEDESLQLSEEKLVSRIREALN